MSKLRDDCFQYWKIEAGGGFRLPCHCKNCKGALFNPAITEWHADHRIPREHGGSDAPPNVRPLMVACHRTKTAEEDVPSIRKGQRQARRVYGIKQSSGFGWNRKFKKKLSGEVVPR